MKNESANQNENNIQKVNNNNSIDLRGDLIQYNHDENTTSIDERKKHTTLRSNCISNQTITI